MTTPHINPLLTDHTLLHAAMAGVLIDLNVDDPDLDDPAQGASWGADRTIRADVLVELLTSTRAPDNGRLRAVRLRGARITGTFDLRAAEIPCSLMLWNCYIEEPIYLREATAASIRLPGCHLPALIADQLRTTGDLALSDGFTAQGEVRLRGAHIGGTFNLSGASLTNPDGSALAAALLTVDQGVLGEDFTAQGQISLNRAHIGGILGLAGATLTNPGGSALAAGGLTVDGGMVCAEGFAAHGEVTLIGAHIGGQLNLSGASLTNPDGSALAADWLTVDESMFCQERFTAEGEVRLLSARIGGECNLNGASLCNQHGTALFADGLTVENELLCSEEFTAHGEIRLLGARIGGQFVLTTARVTNAGGRALAADGLTVDQAMICANGFTAEGEVRMMGTRIGGVLDLRGATLTNPDGLALFADGLAVDHDMHCGQDFTAQDFTAQGELRLRGAHIGGQFDLKGATLTNPGGVTLDLKATKAEALVLLPRKRPDGTVDLTNTRVGAFHDDPASWAVTMRLRGFIYDTLENQQVSVRDRLRWLKLHPGRYTPQLHDQLAATYRRTGHEDAARKVAIDKQWRRRGVLNPAGKVPNWLLWATVGYGYRTWQAAVWLAGLTAVGPLAFGRAYPSHMASTGIDPPAFHPLAYTLDVLLPLVDLGQQSYWHPVGAAMYGSWAFMAAGWVLTTAVVAGLTGVIKRD